MMDTIENAGSDVVTPQPELFRFAFAEDSPIDIVVTSYEPARESYDRDIQPDPHVCTWRAEWRMTAEEWLEECGDDAEADEGAYFEAENRHTRRCEDE